VSRALRRDSRLYLTIDFKSQVLCIHTSTPVPFQDILQVEPLLATSRSACRSACHADCIEDSEGSTAPSIASTSASTSSSHSLSKSSLSLSSVASTLSVPSLPWSQWQHGFVLQTKGSKELTLRCASAAEAAQWVTALHQAMYDAKVTARTQASRKASDDAMWAVHSPSQRTIEKTRNSATPRLLSYCASGKRGPDLLEGL